MVKIFKKEHILHVVLNRPEVRNAFNPEMIAQLTDIFQNLSKNEFSDIKAVLLKGEGTSFCSGGDLAWMQSMIDFSYEKNVQDALRLFDLFEAGSNCQIPIIVQLHGYVFGGAIGLAAIGDIVAADCDSTFCFSEVKLGLAPAVISPFVLRKVSMSFARSLMLTGRIFSAQEAQLCGLVHFVDNKQNVDQWIANTLTCISQNNLSATKAIKQLLHKISTISDWSEIRAYTSQLLAKLRISKDGQDCLKSFLEKSQSPFPKGKGLKSEL